MTGRVTVVACETLAPELASAAAVAGSDMRATTFPCRCGRGPVRWSDLPAVDADGELHVFGGVCLAQMSNDPAAPRGVHLHPLQTCQELIAPRATVESLVHDGAYLVTSGWVHEWERHARALGLTGEGGRRMMADSCRAVVLLDSGVEAAPLESLAALGHALALPVEVQVVGNELLERRLQALALEREVAALRATAARDVRKVADYAMALHFLGHLTAAATELEVASSVVPLLEAMTGAAEVQYVPIVDGRSGEPLASTGDRNGLGGLPDTDALFARVESGFSFLVAADHGPNAVVHLRGLALPEHREAYLDLALNVAPAIGLAVEKARQHEQLVVAEKAVVAERDLAYAKERVMLHQSRLATMGQMLGAIAHQWRQPLNAVAALIQDMEDASQSGALDAPYLRRGVAAAMSQVRYMSNTIDDFRNFFLPEKATEEFSVRSAVDEALGLVSSQLLAHAIEHPVECVPEGDPLLLVGHENELKQVVVNLIMNAIDAIRERRATDSPRAGDPGRITIRLGRMDGRLQIRVADNGAGIAPGAMDRLFDPYFTTKPIGKGTGLGLYMSKVIVENAGGELTAENLPDGAAFTVEVSDDR